MFEIITELLSNPKFQTKVKYLNKTFNKGVKIIEQDKFHTCLYLILKGKVKVCVNSKAKSPLSLFPGLIELGPKDFFGEFVMFDSNPASADVITLTQCEMLEIDIESFKGFLDENPEIGYQIYNDILKGLVNRLRHANNAILNLYLWGMKAHHFDDYLTKDVNSLD